MQGTNSLAGADLSPILWETLRWQKRTARLVAALGATRIKTLLEKAGDPPLDIDSPRETPGVYEPGAVMDMADTEGRVLRVRVTLHAR